MEELFKGMDTLHRFMALNELEKTVVFAQLLGLLTAMDSYESKREATQLLLVSLDMYLEDAEK
ncbi:hypothetical protein [Bacillus phage Anath]|uniref:Uncharacterized protein n=1 Tax=Bacillus phage Anath TaxID=2108114 RepID=A0A2P1JUI9_9CAUD|nr:hypothetical protein [Bacillus phage Anath]